MTTSIRHDVPTIHGLAQAIVAVPYLLGHRPAASLVVIGMKGVPSGFNVAGGSPATIALSARIDVGMPESHQGIVEELESVFARPEVSAALIIAFEDDAADGVNPEALLTRAAASAHRHSVQPSQLARVRDGHFCRVAHDGVSGPWAPIPPAAEVPVIADFVLTGRAPAPDRESSMAALHCSDPAFATHVQQHLEAGVGVCAASAARVLRGVLTDQVGPVSSLDARAVAVLAVSLQDVGIRDSLMTGCMPSRAACFRLAALAAHVPSPMGAPILAVLGYLSWQCGEGALANDAIEAALDQDPNYSLARLVDIALRSAFPPPRPV